MGTADSPVSWIPENLSPGIKQPGFENDYSPSSSVYVKMTGSLLLTSPYAFMACTETTLFFTFLFQVLFVAFED